MMRGYFNLDGLDRVSRWNGPFDGQYMWIGIALHVLFVIAVFLLIIWIVRKLVNSPKKQLVEVNNALNIIKERYAKGEISKEEFEILLKDLR